MHNALKAIALVAAGLAAFIFMSPQASAASAAGTSLTMKQLLSGEVTGNLVQKAQYYRCRRVNRRCRYRFGRGPDYRRCMRRRGCRHFMRRNFRRHRCVRVNRRCRYRFGVGRDYRRCMRRNGCRRFY